MRRLLVVAALSQSACWTGADPAATEVTFASRPAAREPMRLRVKLERTCDGMCPMYTVVVHGDGRVEWTGHANVIAMGRRQGRVSRGELEELSRRLDRAQFFERNEYGALPMKQECVTVAGTTSCTYSASVSICADPAHTIMTASRDSRTHTIDNNQCMDRPELEALEDYIDRIADTEAWIGP
jgi:hypothetical protein